MSETTVSTFDARSLRCYQKRRFLSADAQLTELETVRLLYRRLFEQSISSVQELEQWILDRSELDAALSQQGSVLYIRMTCQTDDAQRAHAYTNFISTIVPAVKPLQDDLSRKFLDELRRFPLPQERYRIYVRKIKSDVDLFVKENVALQTEVDLLSQDYQTICGAMTVEFEGQERTLPEMNKFLLDPDSHLRENAWRASAKRRLKDKDRLDQIFERMLFLRDKIAHNARCTNFCEYKFRSLHRFDYTPEDCRNYHDAVERFVVPLWKKISEKRREQMRLDRLRPWDTAVDPLGRPPLKPFENIAKLTGGCGKIFQRLDAELGQKFLDITESGLLDLASRKGKAPGGYQSTLDEARQPFIFMNAVGLDDDVHTLFHEAGHAFHSLACAHDPLLDYRHGPMEFNEVASMAMELLAEKHLCVFYSSDDARRSQTEHFQDVIFTLVWVATIDAFQHWIYEHPDHTAPERQKMWVKIHRRFGGGLVDWNGLEEEKGFLWHRQLHIFEVPFYYIEYGIAQLGALQIWLNAVQDQRQAISDYKTALALGGSRPLPELYQTAGICFDFSPKTIVPLVEAVSKELRL